MFSRLMNLFSSSRKSGESHELDFKRLIRTRNMCGVKILTSELEGDRPVVAVISTLEGEVTRRYPKNGIFLSNGSESEWDLIQIQDEFVITEVFLNVDKPSRRRPYGEITAYFSETSAKYNGGCDVIGHRVVLDKPIKIKY